MRKFNFDALSTGVGIGCLLMLGASTVSAYGPTGTPSGCTGDHCGQQQSLDCGKTGCKT